MQRRSRALRCWPSCGGGNADGVQKGSLSKFDSLSYALGANIGYSLGYQMKDIPFDAQLIRKGVEETALGKSSLSHDDALETLRTYFMTKRGERAQAIAKQRAEADSVRRAGGDTTKVEYPAADPAMFATEEERDSLSMRWATTSASRSPTPDCRSRWFGLARRFRT